MPAARKAASPIAPVTTGAETAAGSRTRRVRLSRALAATAKASEKQGDAKPKKVKWLSDRYTILADEHAALVDLKARLGALGIKTKKGVLLRAGLKLLAALDDRSLTKIVATVEPSGRKASSIGSAD